MNTKSYFKSQRNLNYVAYMSGLQTVEEMLRHDVEIYEYAVKDLIAQGMEEDEAMTYLLDVFEEERNLKQSEVLL